MSSKVKDLENFCDQLRNRLQDVEVDEYYKSNGYLLRWLQYTNYDVSQSASAFKKTVQWRVENKMDEILNEAENFADLLRLFPLDLTQLDARGRLVVQVLFQKFDCSEANLGKDRDRYLRFAMFYQELIEAKLKEVYYSSGQTRSQYVSIIDCRKMSDHARTLGVQNVIKGIVIIKQIVSTIEKNFPCGVEITHVTNAPKIFRVVYSAIKGLLSSQTVNTFQVHGTDDFDWKVEVLGVHEPSSNVI